MGDKVLEMTFKTGNGKTFRLSFNDPRADITPAEVQSAMNLVISKNLFAVEGNVTEIDKAEIITTQSEALAFV
jgi:hypothetical protein